MYESGFKKVFVLKKYINNNKKKPQYFGNPFCDFYWSNLIEFKKFHIIAF